MFSSDDDPTKTRQKRGPSIGALSLRVIGEGVASMHRLTPGARLIVGRARDSDICVSHHELSRRHAALDVGLKVLVEDLGSRNGVWVAKHRLAPGETVEVGPGESFVVGPLIFLIESAAADPAQPAGDARTAARAPVGTEPPPSLRETIGSIERARIIDALERCAGNQTQAAKRLGISRGTLLSRLDVYGIPRPRGPRRAPG